MASVEFLQKRVSGKEKEIAKLEKKLERINKAKETNWEVNPYLYSEYDLRIVTKDIAKAREALEGYKAKLAKETEKANSRNVKVILDFLEQWKADVKTYYADCVPKYLEARQEYYKACKEHTNWFNSRARIEATAEEKKKMDSKYRKAKRSFQKYWGWLEEYMLLNDSLDMAKLNRDLKLEAEAKYDDIIARTNDIVGEITDASYLRIGAKGDLNGYIIGTKGKASVKTIGAGGYNIQCFHFRTLVREL